MLLALQLTRRLLWRRAISPSFTRMLAMLLGVWVASAATVGLALAAGMNLRHITAGDQLLLFVCFALFALAAFGLGTTEPR
jgi:hypothetical protein